MIFEDLPKPTSLQVSEAGALPSGLLDGQTIDLFGQEVAPASPSARRVGRKAKKTSATSGLSGSGSSASVLLQSFLESKLRQLLPTAGGTMWPQTWKAKDTPAGRQYCQLAVSVSRTKETGSGLWQTPVADDAVERAKGKVNSRGEPKLSAQAMWGTPTARDHMPAHSPEYIAAKKAQGHGMANLNDQVSLAMWPTPKASEATKDSRSPEGALTEVLRNKGPSLSAHAKASMWPTPTVCDYKDTGDMSNSMVRKDGKTRMDTLGRLTFDGSPAQTESKGQLNPEFVSWLMGYSTEHHSSMVTAMQSFRKSRQPSSRRTKTPSVFD